MSVTHDELVTVDVLDQEAVRGHFAGTAAEVDAGTRGVRDGLRWLADRGLLCPPGLRPDRVVEAVRWIRVIAGASLADAFAVWSQTMVAEYLRCCPPGGGLALDATATGTVELDGVALDSAAVLSHDLAAFMALCRPVMLLTQTAMAVGVADAALSSAGDVPDAGGLAEQHRDLVGRRDEIAQRLTALAAGSAQPGDAAAVRLDALHLVAEAVHLDGVLQGGGGFRADSPTGRRRREAAFLPVQAPTEVQLHTLLARG